MSLKPYAIIGSILVVLGGLWYLDHRTVPDQHVFAQTNTASAENVANSTPAVTPDPSPLPEVTPTPTPQIAARVKSITRHHGHGHSD